MRSRYSAYVVGDAAYLSTTWHPDTRPGSIDLDPLQRWYRLDILSRSRGGMLDREGTVEFRAMYRLDGEVFEQHENSTFVRVGRQWLYVDEA